LSIYNAKFCKIIPFYNKDGNKMKENFHPVFYIRQSPWTEGGDRGGRGDRNSLIPKKIVQNSSIHVDG